MAEVIHPEGFQTGEHALSSGSHFLDGRVAQLTVECDRKISAEAEAAVPDGCDLPQIEFALFISKRETLVSP
jgi:hypothetical protein